MTISETGREFLGALVERDFARLEAALAPAVRFRGLIPIGPFEEQGPADAVARFRAWYIEQHVFGDVGDDGITSLDLLCSGVRRDPVAAPPA